jgi:chorismate mutase
MTAFFRTLVLLVVLSGCAHEPHSSFVPTPAEAKIVDLMGQRLGIAHEVAWIKYEKQKPVRDPKREAEVLDRLALLAVPRGLDPAVVRRFFSAQIAASRAQQEDDIHRWKSGAPLPSRAPQNLATDIRPKIDALDRALLDTFKKSLTGRAGLAGFAEGTFRREGLCRNAASIAADALR